MKRFLLATLIGTAALALLLYWHGRERIKREARRFDELCPEADESAEPPEAEPGE